jgi:RNase P subunit RPR2
MSSPDYILHTALVDALPDDHPQAWTSLFCDACGVMVHAFNNEYMRSWVESPDHTRRWCLDCYTANEDDYATEEEVARLTRLTSR